jgi:hypothetical protein
MSNHNKISALFSTALSNGLKSPRITFNTEAGKIQFSLAPATGKNPGCIYVKVDGEYVGKILPNGTFQSVKFCSEVAAYLSDLNLDVVGTVKAYGHRTGNCCFCARHLEDGRSVAVGYGPTCADNFGLPWGDVRVSSQMEIEVPATPVANDNLVCELALAMGAC